ncbi:MAG: endonuclease/exonuclease/phosphatase family protein [Verrucomicrobia bacterium]|nr:endonuclease/exonuclease/phosphatase family protein [Verrucomicrobiota bacterium]
MATWNVELGIGPADSVKYKAQRETLRRVDADIVAFQELQASSRGEWVRLAEDLGYPHRAWGELGPFSGDMVVGYFSRFPILEAHSVRSVRGTREFTRLPLRLAASVPGAARPLTLWNMHHKAEFRYRDCFRRAVEAQRIVQDIQRYRVEHPDRTELVVLGDMNDAAARPEQPERFESLYPRLPWSYRLGFDIRFPVRYRTFPTDHYGEGGLGFHRVPAFRQDSTNAVTHRYTEMTLDYLFVSPAIRDGPFGPPRGEIYHSDWDRGGGGLVKAGVPPPAGTSLKASDHYPVFVDLEIEDDSNRQESLPPAGH